MITLQFHQGFLITNVCIAADYHQLLNTLQTLKPVTTKLMKTGRCSSSISNRNSNRYQDITKSQTALECLES